MDTRKASLFLICGAERPGVPFSKRKPRTLLSHLHRAQMSKRSLQCRLRDRNTTIAKGTYATDALEIHVLLPFRMNPSSTSSAVVTNPAGSEPDSVQ